MQKNTFNYLRAAFGGNNVAKEIPVHETTEKYFQLPAGQRRAAFGGYNAECRDARERIISTGNYR